MIATDLDVHPRGRNRRAGACALVLCLFMAPLPAAPEFVREDEFVARVIALLDQRLALMSEVAAVKFQQRRPVADPAREREVVGQAAVDAGLVHLDAEAARNFFAIQIQMARAVQERLFTQWQAGERQPPATRDLVRELRPELDALGRKLMPAVYLASPALVTMPVPELRTRLSGLLRYVGVTDDLLDELARALGALRITGPPSWASVQRVGTLRVGTTGDYAPFSDDRGGALQGVDIELAEGLARAWSVSVVFVRTHWPTLMDDLHRRRFDLAASGISITPERSRQAAFSSPYLFDGKTPIARREDAARFSSLAAIDQPGVRVIVNPGGTNERFVREHLAHATIRVHPDNRTIFEEIIARRADVMIPTALRCGCRSAGIRN